jgi:hypothetical protein
MLDLRGSLQVAIVEMPTGLGPFQGTERLFCGGVTAEVTAGRVSTASTVDYCILDI